MLDNVSLDSLELKKLSKGDEIVNKYKSKLEGILQCEINKQKEIAKQKSINNIDIDTIVKCTVLAKEEIEKL